MINPNHIEVFGISTEAVQDAISIYYGTKSGWPLYPIDKITEALRFVGYIAEDEYCLRFDSYKEVMIIATDNPQKSYTFLERLKRKLRKWVLN